ncbi:hypothetical protein GCM10009733_007510 [Nonomuraea maheshkhaliensis]|uniref:Uncharacterized protein n=1 Tax=Nonomuraea maheshkhaliensis TaxID=419590 RepID=A0ABN2EPU5_9ACTN
MTEQPHPEPELRLCPTCQAMPPKTADMVLIMSAGKDGEVVHQLHASDCGDYLEWHVWMEIGAEQVRQEQEHAERLFPDAVVRFQAALQALSAEQADSPFVKALAELVTLKDTKFRGLGGFVILPEWADILNRHFPDR